MALVDRAVLREVAAEVVQVGQLVAQTTGVDIPLGVDQCLLGGGVWRIDDFRVEALIGIGRVVEVLPEVGVAHAVARQVARQRRIQAAQVAGIEPRQAALQVGHRAIVEAPGQANMILQQTRGVLRAVATRRGAEYRTGVVEQKTAGRRHILANAHIVGQAAGAARAATGGE